MAVGTGSAIHRGIEKRSFDSSSQGHLSFQGLSYRLDDAVVMASSVASQGFFQGSAD
jgi:hypothetical protein